MTAPKDSIQLKLTITAAYSVRLPNAWLRRSPTTKGRFTPPRFTTNSAGLFSVEGANSFASGTGL